MESLESVGEFVGRRVVFSCVGKQEGTPCIIGHVGRHVKVEHPSVADTFVFTST